MSTVSILSVTLNSLLFLLIILSYAPQYLRIRHHQTTHDLSPFFILLCSLSSTANLANLLTLPVTFYNIHEHCRYDFSDARCKLELMPHWQVGAHWICSQTLFLQYLWHRKSARCSTASSLFTASLFHVFLLGPSLFFALQPPFYGPGYFIIMQVWSWICICISALLCLLLFIPQIYRTFTLKPAESLSIRTMVMQVLAYFLLAASLAVRFPIDTRESVFANYTDRAVVWVNYLVMGLGESVLLGGLLYFGYGRPVKDPVEGSENGSAGGSGDRHAPEEGDEREDADEAHNEETPLLSTEPGRTES